MSVCSRCPGWEVLTGQGEYVGQGFAVVEPYGDDTVRPEPPGAQLIQLPAGVDAVVTGQYPVIGGSGDQHPDPADKTCDEAKKLQTSAGHVLCGSPELADRSGEEDRSDEKLRSVTATG